MIDKKHHSIRFTFKSITVFNRNLPPGGASCNSYTNYKPLFVYGNVEKHKPKQPKNKGVFIALVILFAIILI